MEKLISPSQMQDVLKSCYELAIKGVPGSPSVLALASEYSKRYSDVRRAANEMVKNQIIKCGTSGFLTSLGGFITLPVALPANIASVLYVQLRMIAAIAVLGGFDPSDDAVQTMAYICLLGEMVKGPVKQVGVKVSNRVALNALNKLPGKVLTKINQKVGMRLLTKFGTKGIINIVKLVPLAGGLVGAGVDVLSTHQVAAVAIHRFLDRNMETDIVTALDLEIEADTEA